ncbi:MAG: threonine synthase [bacterium]|nr:threonine synthase [bacterium]
MASILELKCVVCQRRYSPDEVQYTCPTCGEVGTLDVLYDYAALARDYQRKTFVDSNTFSMWRYRALLPLKPDSAVPPLRVGWTPLYETPRIAAQLGVARAWVKDDGANPTGSLKDRASALVVAKAMEQGISTISTASTGNAAAALAGVCASVGLQPLIFVPATAPEAKISQLLVYGAKVLLIEDTYDTAFDLCMTLSQQEGWYCRNTGVNPFTTEGKKTVAFEIAEQSDWNVPDVVVVSVGDGNIIAGVYKGFYDLRELGWIERIPRLIGVQSETSAPLVHAWENGLDGHQMQPTAAYSIADSIVAGVPRDRVKALRAVRETAGALMAVPDERILAAIPEFAQLSGVFAEPAAAAAYAGAKQAVEQGIISADETVLILSTGNGLKDVRRAQQSVQGGVRVAPAIDAARAAAQAVLGVANR